MHGVPKKWWMKLGWMIASNKDTHFTWNIKQTQHTKYTLNRSKYLWHIYAYGVMLAMHAWSSLRSTFQNFIFLRNIMDHPLNLL